MGSGPLRTSWTWLTSPSCTRGCFGEETHPEVADYDVELSQDGLVASNARFWQPKPTNTIERDGIDVGYRYYVPRP